MARRIRWLVVVALIGATAVGLGASAARAATYSSPGYHGTTQPVPTAAPVTPPPVVVGAGNDPSVVVDAAGTAHIAWTTDDGDQADALHYCRLKRGASSCDATAVLRPEPTAASNYDPAYNIEAGGPQLYILGSQLVMVSHRGSFSGFTNPDGSTGGTTLIYVSQDGGSSWSPVDGVPQYGIAGTADIGGPGVTYGSELDPKIGTINALDTDGTVFQELSPGAFTSQSALIGPGLQEGSSGSLAVDHGLPVAAFHGPASNVGLRRFTGVGSPNDVANWGPLQQFPGSDPQLAGGPSGLYLMDSELSQEPLSVHQLSESGDGSTSEGAGTQISEDDANDAYLTEGPDGSLFAAWSGAAGLRLNTAARGGAWATAQGTTIEATASALNETKVGAAADGGGFVVVHQGAGTATEAAIVAVPFGAQTATGVPGLGNLPGGAGDTTATTGCSTITFGTVVLHVAANCFLHGTGAAAADDVSDAAVSLNGLTITPDAASAARAAAGGPTQIIVNAQQHTIDSTGPVTVSLSAPALPPIVLWHGEIHVRLPNAGSGATLFDFPTSQFPTTIEGFPVSAHTPVRLSDGGVQIPVDITLPAGFGGVTGHAVLTAHSPGGLDLDSLHIEIPDGTDLGFATLNGVTLDYDRASDTWSGGGSIYIPGPDFTLTVHLTFQDGKFDEGDVTVKEYPGYAIYPPYDLYLGEVGLSLHLNPLAIGGHALIGAVPFDTDQIYLASVIGGLQLRFSPFDIKITADGRILNTPVSASTLEYGSGALSFDGSLKLEIVGTGIVGAMHVYIGHHTFNGSVMAKVCALGVACENLVDVTVSNHGAAYCFPHGISITLPVLGKITIDPSVTHDWDSPIPVVPHYSCVHEDSAPELRAHSADAAGSSTFTVPAGVPSFDVGLFGTTGAPAVSLTGPSGAAIQLGQYAHAAAGVTSLGDSTFIGLARPAPGIYTVTPLPDSAPIVAQEFSRGFATPTVLGARLSRHGRSLRLRYRIKPVPGVAVDFVERTARGDAEIGTARGRGGTLHFTSAAGPAGRRTIIARAVVDGQSFKLRAVASYRAPGPPKPGAVRRLTVRRAHGGLSIRFRAGANAADYMVRVGLPHHVTISRLLTGAHHTVSIPGVGAKQAATVTVTTISPTGLRSRPSTARAPTGRRRGRHPGR